MDEEDSQEVLVNRKVSQRRGQRNLFVLTDEEDSAAEGGNSEESVGSREEDEAEEDRDEDEEDSDVCLEREDGAMKGVEGSAARVAALLDDLSSDDEAEKCPICLHSFQEQPVATPASCLHHFCLDCILEWSKNVNSCPVDRLAFGSIHLRKCYGGKVQKMIPVQEPVKVEEEEISVDFDQTSCEVCGRRDREDRLLLCDGCDAGYHIECLTPPLDAVPVEEWFCPECTSNNPHTDSAEEVSEDEVVALQTDAVPTSGRLRTSTAGRMRSIARTRQSERVRATVNRNRITQAHAHQHVPRYLIQSTWLDGTISAVLNSSACTHKGKTDEKHLKTQRKKASTESSSSSSSKNRTAGKDIKLHRGHLNSTRLGQKQVAKKDPAPHSRITKSSRTGKPKQSPPARPLGYHPKIRPASLSVYGDSSDLDPFDDESSAGESLPVVDMSRRGLSHSALRSHQPVARPIQHGLSRHSSSMSETDIMEDSAPVPDLLGNILSGQSLLLMDSSTMVINRDGSLKLGKPVCASSSKTSISSHTDTFEFETEVHVGIASGSGSSGDTEPSHPLPHTPSSSHSFPGPSSSSAKPTSPLAPPIMPGNVCSPNLAPERPPNVCAPQPVNPVALSQRSWSKTSSPSLPLRHSNSMSDWASREKGADTGVGTVKKALSKPLLLDVSRLPRIPKIRRGADSRTTPQDRAGTSCTSSFSSSWTSTLNPSSSSTVSICVSAPRSVLHTRCPSSPERHTSSLGSAENRLSEKQSGKLHDPFHLIGSQLLCSDGVPEGNTLDHHSKGVMPGEKGVVPYVYGCNYDDADFRTKPESIDEAIKERTKYSECSENVKMERVSHRNLLQEGQPAICNSRTDVANANSKKCRSRNVSSSQKQDSCLRSEKNKSKPKDRHSRSRSSSCSAPRGKSDPDARGKLKDRHTWSGGPDGSRSGTETKMKSRETTTSCSPSKERKRVRSSSESSPSESPERPRKRRRCSPSRSPQRWSNSSSGDPSRNGIPSERDHEWRNRKGSESQGLSQPRSRSRSRSRERRKDQVRSQSSRRSKDRSRSKDGNRARSRSLSRDRKNEKDSTHSSCSRENSRSTEIPTSVSPADLVNNQKPVSLKYPKDPTDHKEMQQGKHFSHSNVRKPQKLKTEKNASLSGVKEEVSAFVFVDKKGKSRSENKKEKKRKREIKADLEKMAKIELRVQSHMKSSCQPQMTTYVETDPQPAILPIGKKEHFSEVTDSAGSVSPQKRFVAQEEKGMKESLPATHPKKRPKEISVEDTNHLSVGYTLNSQGVRKSVNTEVTGTACDMGSTVITDTPETVGGMESTVITDTSEAVGGMESTVTTDTTDTVGNMESTVITDTPETIVGMENTVIADTPETITGMENTVITDTPDTVGDMESTVITDTSETVGDMEGTVITDTPETVGNMESTVITAISETVGDMGDAKIMDRLVAKQEGQEAVKPEMVPAVIVASSTRSRRPVKRVTWSLQEVDAPPAQPKRLLPPNTVRQSDKDGLQIPASPTQEQDMKKLHLKERAVEEVKLAIKPFFQKKEITKEEYKEIWGKAVQKICCSKSGEISPERVANLVKAYVEKYQLLKKQQKERRSQELEGTL
ncbi:hypothetical protein SKAU_G00347550 [Synaphobranchus kaupii]|uniref:PHD and RING finger domain-containing protein 1 n=1 Tax=Synaphobranchus kaupii TaxID=118154 RepID=A0A9Q1EJT6_SYNKA|nr:hypothetical protein SKAU_G00347550 [Synaphobranchus kaupii]